MKKKKVYRANNHTEILVAEDSPTQAGQIQHLLESHHYTVIVAPDGKQAMDLLMKHKPSLVISDIIMPEMNGYELCKNIKTNKKTENIPVILLTRLFDKEEIIEGLSCGADSFITKPYDEKYLISHIEKILSEETVGSQKKVPFGIQILFNGKKRFIQAEQRNVIKLMLDVYEGAIAKNEKLIKTEEKLRLLNENLETMVADRTAKLESQYSLLNTIINNPHAITIFSLDNNYCYTSFNENHRQEMIKVWNADIQIGTNILEYMNDTELRSLAKISIDRALNGEAFSEIQHQPEQDIYYELNWNPILHGTVIVGVTTFISDITERKKTENQIILRNQQLAEANTKKDKFFSIIAHDLRSPFQGLLQLTEMMSDANEHFTLTELNSFSKSLNESANNLYLLLGNLLEWATIQKGSLSYSPQELNLSAIAYQSIKLMNERALQKGISIVLEVPDNQKIFADERMLETILRNLISNAVKFTVNGGIVKIKSQKIENRKIEISVSDTGVGMSRELVKNLFRIDGMVGSKGTDGEISTGLGLVLCKEFIEMHGGSIKVESETGKGSKFFFSISES